MDVLVEQLSEENAQDCEEALETVQLVLVSGEVPVISTILKVKIITRKCQ